MFVFKKVKHSFSSSMVTLCTRYRCIEIWSNYLQALIHCYPDINLFPWMFDEEVPPGFWKNTENQRYNHSKNFNQLIFQRSFFAWLYTHLGYICMDDWYKVTTEDVYKNGGAGLLAKYYNGSPSSALQSVYPE